MLLDIFLLMPYRPVDQGDGGKHRALLIGINYKGCGAGELKGCHNDVEQMREYITTHVSGGEHRLFFVTRTTSLLCCT